MGADGSWITEFSYTSCGSERREPVGKPVGRPPFTSERMRCVYCRHCLTSERRRTTRTSVVWRRSTTPWRAPVTPGRSASRCCSTTGPTSESSTTRGTPNYIRSARHRPPAQLSPVYTIQPVVKPCLSNPFDNRLDNRLYRVYKH